jgi:hypothetical protein
MKDFHSKGFTRSPIVAKVKRGERVPEEHTFLILSRAWAEDGVWNVSAFDLPVAVFGTTLEEAQRHFDDAIVTHFFGLQELGKVDSTIKCLQDLAEERGFFAERLLEADRRESELAYPLLMTNSEEMLCGAHA